MNDAVRVCVGHCVDDLDEESNRLVDGQLPAFLESFAQRLPFNVRHDEEQASAGFSGVEKREDMRMLQLRGDLDLTLESCGSDRRREIFAENLEGDFAIVLQVAR